MENNGFEEVSVIDMKLKIDDMKKLKASLLRELNQHYLDCQNYRDTTDALAKKMQEIKADLASTDKLVVERRDEVNNLESKIREDSRIIEAEKRDLVALRSSVSAEQEVFHKEKQASLEMIENETKNLTRLEISLKNRDSELKNREKEVAGELEEVNKRKAVTEASERNLSSKQSEIEKMDKDSKEALRSSEKALDEANGLKSKYESLLSDIKLKESELSEKESSIKMSQNEVDAKKKELSSRERDVVIEEDRLRNIKDKLRQEIKYSAINKDKKAEINSELGDKDKPA